MIVFTGPNNVINYWLQAPRGEWFLYFLLKNKLKIELLFHNYLFHLQNWLLIYIMFQLFTFPDKSHCSKAWLASPAPLFSCTVVHEKPTWNRQCHSLYGHRSHLAQVETSPCVPWAIAAVSHPERTVYFQMFLLTHCLKGPGSNVISINAPFTVAIIFDTALCPGSFLCLQELVSKLPWMWMVLSNALIIRKPLRLLWGFLIV